MDENKVKELIKKEMDRREKSKRFGLQNSIQHTHDGDNSPKVPINNLDTSPVVTGNVSFATSDVDYIFELNLPYTPRQVTLHGIFRDSKDNNSGIDNRYIVFGTASLTKAFYLQPVNNRTVAVGGLEYPAPDTIEDGTRHTLPVQSSTFFGFIKGSDEATAGTGQFDIVNIFGSATIVVTVIEFSRDRLVFRTHNISSDWKLDANYLIV